MSPFLVYFMALVLAFCSMSYELLLAQQVSELAGDAFMWESISIAAFIAGMGYGAFKSSKALDYHPLRSPAIGLMDSLLFIVFNVALEF